jgi:hypothetical protein
MKRHYTRTFAGMALVFGVAAIAALLANAAAGEAKSRYQKLLATDKAEGARRRDEREKVETLSRAMTPLREFAAAWKPVAHLPEKDAAERVRSDIEAIAQRQLGLVTDNAITPQPDRFLFQGIPVRVQRVTLRASGKDLVALVSWLGKVEERYPAAIVEACEFSSNVGGSTGLSLRLVQPVTEPAAHRMPIPSPLPDSMLTPDTITALDWPRYLPQRLKSAIAVGFSRNPLQPAIPGEQRSVPSIHDLSDEITPRLEMALEGKLRSVIHGAAPIIVVDGRVFHPGDEIFIGRGREKPVPDAKTKLKQIGGDRLLFHVAGGTTDKPIQCDVAYALPAFLQGL